MTSPAPRDHETLRRMRRFHEGVLMLGERFERTKFVIDALTGRPVFPAPLGLFDEDSVALHAPEDEPGAVVVMGKPAPLDPLRDESCDRWQIFFGKSFAAKWGAIDIESVKNVGVVVDGADAMAPNPLRRFEPAICREVSSDHAALARLCRRVTGGDPKAPLMVGLDPYGIDIRADFGVIRVEFDTIALTEEDAKGAIRALMAVGDGR